MRRGHSLVVVSCSEFPFFFDTLFYLMMPLAKSIGLRDKSRYALFVMSIIAGGTMAHSLVPPTPGPLLVATQLNVPIGLMMIGGLLIGCITCWVGQLYAQWAIRRWPLPIRDSGGVTLKELEKQSKIDDHNLPPSVMVTIAHPATCHPDRPPVPYFHGGIRSKFQSNSP